MSRRFESCSVDWTGSVFVAEHVFNLMAKVNDKIEIFYPYNSSFKTYGEAKAGMTRAQAFCDKQNEYKGGHWVVHTKAQHDRWWNRVGRAQFEAEVHLGIFRP